MYIYSQNKDQKCHLLKRGKKHPYHCFTNLSEEKSIPMTALWCPAFSNHG